jgi:hypothetical protein
MEFSELDVDKGQAARSKERAQAALVVATVPLDRAETRKANAGH